MIALISKNAFIFIILAINLSASLLYFLVINNDRMKSAFHDLPIAVQKFYVLLFVGPLFGSPFIPQPTYDFHNTIVDILGIVFSVTGSTFIFLAFRRIGTVPSIKSKTGLSTTGMYGIVRHPIYAGTILIFLGLILFQESVIPSIYFPVSILLYYLMAIFEEKDLMKIFGDEYTAYKKKVKKRIIPYIL